MNDCVIRSAQALDEMHGSNSVKSNLEDASTSTSKRKPRKSKALKVTHPSITELLREHDPTGWTVDNSLPTEAPKSPGVLYRPTQRAKRMRLGQGTQQAGEADKDIGLARKRKEGSGVSGSQPISVFGDLNLPKVVRRQVWIHAVVYQQVFVWPDSKLGAEQPDLAMTCRAIRREVLPIFYDLNIFAIDISPRTPSQRSIKSGAHLSPMSTKIGRWLDLLDTGGHVAHIRRLVLSYEPSVDKAALKSGPKTQSCIVVLEFSECGIENNKIRDVKAEIHRDAGCLLQGFDECGKCRPVQNPDWLTILARVILCRARDQRLDGVQLKKFAGMLLAGVDDLGESICQDPLHESQWQQSW